MPKNITDYGAIANDGLNDQTAITNAIAAAKAAGDSVYVPNGTFNHNNQILLDGVVMYGNGDSSHLKGTTTGDFAIDLRGTNPGLHNLLIEGTGSGTRTSNREANGVYIFDSDGYVVKNVHVKNVSGAGIMTEQGSNGKILNNLVELTGADGIYSTEGTHGLEVAYNKTIATGDDAISFTSYQSAAGKVYDIDVHHNTVTGSWQSRSITVNGGDQIAIHDNHVDGGTAGISVGATTAWGSQQNTNITVTNNTVRDATFTGEGTIGGGALHLYNNQTGTDSNITFSGNEVVTPADSGIYVWGTNQIDADVINNDFFMTSTHQVYENDNAGATQINETGNLRYDPSAYTGDMISASVGGLDPNYVYGGTTPPSETPTFTTANYTGTSANETIIGNDLANIIDGQGGNDTIKGGLADDRLIGHSGGDILYGGGGNDRHDWNLYSQFGTTVRDKVMDWATGDRLDVYDLDSNNTSGDGNQAFTFLGTGALTGAGQIRYWQDSPNNLTHVEFSNDADSAVEYTVDIVGLHTLASTSFVL